MDEGLIACAHDGSEREVSMQAGAAVERVRVGLVVNGGEVVVAGKHSSQTSEIGEIGEQFS